MNIGRTRWRVGEQAIANKHKHTHTHTHTQSVPRDTEDGWSLKQGSDAILTHVNVAPH